MTRKLPKWFDENNIVLATYISNANISQIGYVMDLKDGTCRLISSISLPGLRFGDRVDLFFDPEEPSARPWIGFRVYDKGKMILGDNKWTRLDVHEKFVIAASKPSDSDKCVVLSELERNREISKLRDDYYNLHIEHATILLNLIKLEQFVSQQGLDIPEDLYTKSTAEEIEEDKDDLDHDRIETKKFLLSLLEDYDDIDI